MKSSSLRPSSPCLAESQVRIGECAKLGKIVIDGQEYKLRGKPPEFLRSFFVGKLQVGEEVVAIVTENDVRLMRLVEEASNRRIESSG